MAAPLTIPGQDTLDSPPPNPATQTGMSPGVPLGAMAGPSPVPIQRIPPQMLTGMLQAGEQMSTMLDAFAQAAPDLAAEFGQVKDTLLQALAKLTMAGGGPTAPTAPGPNFPGGGLDRGGMPLASGG